MASGPSDGDAALRAQAAAAVLSAQQKKTPQPLGAELLEHVTTLIPPGEGLPASNLLGGLVVGLSLCNVVMPSIIGEALALVPHHTVFSPVAAFPIPFCWNLVTCHFLEASILKLAVVAPALVGLARLLERLWTLRSMALHLLFTSLCSGVVVFFVEVVEVYRTQRFRDFFEPVQGCVGLLVALAVGLRQAYPLEALPGLPRAWGLNFQHLPFGLAALITAIGLLGPSWLLPEWPFAPLALFFGWLHLRYLMWFPYTKAHGDHSPEFLFTGFFPRPLRPLISCLGALAFALGSLAAPSFLRLREAEGAGVNLGYDAAAAAAGDAAERGAGGGFSAAQGLGAAAAAAGGAGAVPGGPGSKEYDARRAKALQLLDANINSLLAPDSGARALTMPRGVAEAAQGGERP